MSTPHETVEEETLFQAGDWVRFYQDGRLLIGVVQRVRKRTNYPYTVELLTDIGAVRADSVVEYKR